MFFMIGFATVFVIVFSAFAVSMYTTRSKTKQEDTSATTSDDSTRTKTQSKETPKPSQRSLLFQSYMLGIFLPFVLFLLALIGLFPAVRAWSLENTDMLGYMSLAFLIFGIPFNEFGHERTFMYLLFVAFLVTGGVFLYQKEYAPQMEKMGKSDFSQQQEEVDAYHPEPSDFVGAWKLTATGPNWQRTRNETRESRVENFSMSSDSIAFDIRGANGSIIHWTGNIDGTTVSGTWINTHHSTNPLYNGTWNGTMYPGPIVSGTAQDSVPGNKQATWALRLEKK